MRDSAVILWRRLDAPGHEASRLAARDGGWELAGCAVFSHEARPCRLDYRIACDAAWRTRTARVTGWVGSTEIRVEIEADEHGRWTLNGAPVPAVQGCTDVDLNFSPSTNLLPIRRLALAVGREAEVNAAWLRFPSFALERLPQRYRRNAARTYRYESGGGAFATELDVDDAGLVTHYPSFFRVEDAAAH
jgi:hypothetical protein